MPESNNPYVSIERWGHCHVCGEYQDLRMGVCFDCCDQVDGKRLSATTHRLWERANPYNEWIVTEDGTNT